MDNTVLDSLFEKSGGLMRTADVISAGVTKDEFYRYVKKEGLEKVAHGVYAHPDNWIDEMAALQAQYPKVIFSHETALYLHDLAEKEPVPISVTVPAKYNVRSLSEKGVRLYYIKQEWYLLGVCDVTTSSGQRVASYDMERTILDIIRKKKEMDVAVFNYALRTYVNLKDKDYNKLMGYAKELHMENRLRAVMGVLL